MGKRGHSEEEILRVLREAESGDTVMEICGKHGISQQTFYLCKKKYAGLGLNELRELRQLREENAKLKRLVVVDQANTRSVRFLVSDGASFFSDEQRDARHTVDWTEPGVPGCRIESRCKAERYTIIKDTITDPTRDTLIMRVSFTTSEPESALKLYLFIEPQMGDRDANKGAWVGRKEGSGNAVLTA